MRRIHAFGVAFALVLGAFVGEAAAAQSGTAIAVVQQAQVDGQSGLLVLQPQAAIHSGDRIVTGATGEAQIVFLDNTRLVVGPSSSMVIDAFVFNPNGTAQQVAIGVAKGAFRFITGNSSSSVYSITTPTSTIGVRGTEFDVSVENRTGVTRVVNFTGVTRVCRRQADGSLLGGSDCVEMRDPCTLSVARPRQQIVRYSGEDPNFRTQQLQFYFPYVRSQQSLLAPFRVNAERCLSSTPVIRGTAPEGTLPTSEPPPPYVPNLERPRAPDVKKPPEPKPGKRR